MNPVVETLAWLAAVWLVAGIYVAVAKPFRPEPAPHRSPAHVQRDIAENRARRDLNTCRAIWPDAPSARVITTQHRLDTARQRKEDTP
ncbi:hypothetical protein ACGF5F_32450 [Streptomyces sp. NPDC047821]|uniref:hypothetical protein n=1 Tax=Streptomyces sp. NPDC047821 TaxID=3365488 RepID=UPI0037155D6C